MLKLPAYSLIKVKGWPASRRTFYVEAFLFRNQILVVQILLILDQQLVYSFRGPQHNRCNRKTLIS